MQEWSEEIPVTLSLPKKISLGLPRIAGQSWLLPDRELPWQISV